MHAGHQQQNTSTPHSKAKIRDSSATAVRPDEEFLGELSDIEEL